MLRAFAGLMAVTAIWGGYLATTAPRGASSGYLTIAVGVACGAYALRGSRR
jgi:hypothetical protein